ncbi:MAG: amidohydrolase family protein [Xanthobacteraceae bacterium]|uniref:amidohydrolase family protein n=1 Tax=Pseudolabrys sp. TaxID=1960880 RepID=UPI003D111D5B
MTTAIDAWTHIFPPAYFQKLQGVASATGPLKRWMTLKSLYDLDVRFRIMDRFENYAQVLTPSMPPVEELGEADEAAALAMLMNNGLAELVARYPARFPYFVGALSFLDADLAQREIERALGLGAKGFQICTHVRGRPLDDPAFLPIFDAIAKANVPIWLHPVRGPVPDYPTLPKSKYEVWWCFGWPYESSVAMSHIVFAGLFDRHPGLRIITHHLGAMIPYFAGRIEQGWDLEMGTRTPPADADLLPVPLKRKPSDYFKMFYADTALSGSAGATRCGLDYFGGRQVLFASDFPYDAEGGSYLVRETLRAIGDLKLAPAEHADILHGNLRRFIAA